MTYYKQEDLEPLYKTKKKSIIIIIVVMVVSALIDTGLMFITTEDNVTWMKIITSVIMVLSGWYSIGLLFLSVLVKRRRIKHIEAVLNNPKKKLDGKIIEIRNPLTLANGIYAYEITIIKDKIKHTLYFENDLGDPTFKVGDEIEVEVSTSNFIYSLEVIQNGNI